VLGEDGQAIGQAIRSDEFETRQLHRLFFISAGYMPALRHRTPNAAGNARVRAELSAGGNMTQNQIFSVILPPGVGHLPKHIDTRTGQSNTQGHI
jgi:hypothetical protein